MQPLIHAATSEKAQNLPQIHGFKMTNSTDRIMKKTIQM